MEINIQIILFSHNSKNEIVKEEKTIVVSSENSQKKRINYLTLTPNFERDLFVRKRDLAMLEYAVKTYDKPIYLNGDYEQCLALAATYFGFHASEYDNIGWLHYNTSYNFTLIKELSTYREKHFETHDFERVAREIFIDKFVNSTGKTLVIIDSIDSESDLMSNELAAYPLNNCIVLYIPLSKLTLDKRFMLLRVDAFNQTERHLLYDNLPNSILVEVAELDLKIKEDVYAISLLNKHLPHDDVIKAQNLIKQITEITKAKEKNEIEGVDITKALFDINSPSSIAQWLLLQLAVLPNQVYDIEEIARFLNFIEVKKDEDANMEFDVDENPDLSFCKGWQAFDLAMNVKESKQKFHLEDVLVELTEGYWIEQTENGFRVFPQSKVVVEKFYCDSISAFFKDMIEVYRIDYFLAESGFLKGNIEYINHVNSLLNFIGASRFDEQILLLQQHLIDVFIDLRLYNDALNALNQRLNILINKYSENSLPVADVYSDLFRIFMDTGHYTEAFHYAQKDLIICEKILGKYDTRLASSYNNVAVIYKAQGNYEKALAFAMKAIAIYEKVLDKDHPSLATSYNNVALIYKDQGNYEKALEFALKAIAIREKVLDKDHPDLATSYNTLASLYQDQGNYEKALEFALKGITIGEKVLDKDHPSLATSYNNVAMIYQDQGNYEKALEFALKAIAIEEKVLDKDHPNLGTSYWSIAAVYYALKDYPKAIDFIDKAVGIYQKALPREHPYQERVLGWQRAIDAALAGEEKG